MQLKKQLVSFLTSHKKQDDIHLSFPLDYMIPVYHAVSDEKLPHLQHIISYKNTKDFEKDIDYIAQNFQFVDWEEFKNFINGSFKPSKKIALLTFDDGLREFKTIIAPILLRKGIFAINFINSEFIDNQDMMFRNKASILIDEILKLKNIPEKLFKIVENETNNQENLIKKILKIDFKNREKLNQIAEQLDVDFSTYLTENQPYLNIEELHALKDDGFMFGAHSMNHPLYHELSIERQIEETKDSLKYLKNNSLRAESFAFPFTDFGVSKAFFQELFLQEKQLFCTFGSAGIKTDSFAKNFQRIPMENKQSAEEILKEEITYYQLKKWLNKNTIIRK